MDMSSTNLIALGDLSQTTTYQAGIVQATVHRRLQKFCDNVLLPYGITKIHWLIIGIVYDHRATGVRISDLAKIVGTNLPYMTNTVNLLEGKRILERIDNHLDSRSTFVSVHSKFMPKCKKIEVAMRNALRVEIYAGISPEDFRIYMKVLYGLSRP